MNFRKIIPALLMAMCISLVTPAFATNETPFPATEKTTEDALARQLMNRLIEIRDMDKSNLTSSERKTLRKEVKEMKKEIRAEKRKSGIYISLAAIVIIVLLLILIL